MDKFSKFFQDLESNGKRYNRKVVLLSRQRRIHLVDS